MDNARFRIRLAEVLAARLCHDLVNPLGAVVNGVEILEEDPTFAADAAHLIATSARQATARLQFYRMAYGATADLLPEAVAKAIAAFFADTKIVCEWPRVWPEAWLSWLKPTMNLAVLAAEALPRGGLIRILMPDKPHEGILVEATGTAARLPDLSVAALALDLAPDALGPRTVQAAFTAALVRCHAGDIIVDQATKDTVLLRAAL